MTEPSPIPISLRAACIHGYEWPSEFRQYLEDNRRSVAFDRHALLRLASDDLSHGFFVIAMVSREHLELGLIWARWAQRAGLTRFALAATDSDTADVLQSEGLRHVRVELSTGMTSIAHYRNPSGFSGKAMAIFHCRLALVKFLIDRGFDAIICDVDGLLMQNPEPFLPKDADIAFQRVVYSPAPLVKRWGFAGCGGFVAYRASRRVATFLDRVLAIQHEVSCDQLAFNLALLEDGVRWSSTTEETEEQEEREAVFAKLASQYVHGRTEGLGLSVQALPADAFWRHAFVPLDLTVTVLLHPNSPKSAEGKLAVLRRLLGPL